MESFAKRYKSLCDKTGLTRENMSKLLDIGIVSVEALETGYNEPKIQTLMRLAQIFNVSVGYMALLTDDPKVSEDPFTKEVYVVDSLWGKDGTVMKENVVGTAFINRADMHGKDYSAMVMMDDSMVKSRIYKDDILIVRKQSAANNGEVVVAVVDGIEIVRRYHRTGNIITLTAEGDSFKYKTLKFDESETKFKVLGVVCEVRIKNI